MKAKLIKEQQNGRNYGQEKELVGAYSVLGKINGEIREVVVARAYMGRSRNSSVVYASIWVHGDGFYTAGHGSAGGYGYHKESQAFQEAITSAGIDLYGSAYTPERWNYSEQRAYTEKEMLSMQRKNAKKRCFIGGVGDSAMRSAFEAIARSAGARGKLCFVSH